MQGQPAAPRLVRNDNERVKRPERARRDALGAGVYPWSAADLNATPQDRLARRNARRARRRSRACRAPQSTIDEQDLERALLRKSVDALADGRSAAPTAGARRSIGETLYRYAGGATVCELCRPLRRGEPVAQRARAPQRVRPRRPRAPPEPRRRRRTRGARRVDCRADGAVTLTTTIASPREEVFEYLADVANHAEFTDHCMVDWHLTREDSYGRGAGARFRVKSRFDRFSYGDITLAELTPPERIVATGRAGRFNRIRTRSDVDAGGRRRRAARRSRSRPSRRPR